MCTIRQHSITPSLFCLSKSCFRVARADLRPLRNAHPTQALGLRWPRVLKKRLRAVRQSRTENSRNWSSSFIMFHILCKIDLSLSEHILACLTVAVGLSSFCFKHLQTLKTIVAEPLHLGLSAFAAAGVIQPLPQRGVAALFQLWKYCCLEIESIFVWSLNGLVVVIQDLN